MGATAEQKAESRAPAVRLLSPGSGTAPQGLAPGGAGCEVGVACGQLIRWFPSRQAGPGSAGLAAAPRASVRVFATVVFALGSGCLTGADRRVEAVGLRGSCASGFPAAVLRWFFLSALVCVGSGLRVETRDEAHRGYMACPARVLKVVRG